MANGISLPVKLSIENLQQIIQELQSKLSTLKIGSGGYKAVSGDIRKLQLEVDKLQNQASKPFITERQFDAASRSVDKIEEKINQLQIDVGRVKFSDLQLSSADQAILDDFNNKIKQIQTSLTQLKQQAKADFLASDMGKIWADLNPTAATKSFTQITRNIESAVDAQQRAVKKAEEALNDYQRAMNLGTAAEKFIGAKNPLSAETMGADFSKFFSENKNGVLAFKSGAKPLFEEWLQKNLDIDPNTAHALVQKSAGQIKLELQNAESEIRKALQEKITRGTNANGQINNAKAKYDEEYASLTQLKSILEAVSATNDKMTTSEDKLQTSLTTTTTQFNAWKDSVTAAAQSGQTYEGAARKIKAECQNLHSTLAASTAEFLRQQRVLNNFNAIKMAIVNFMGFRQVLNLVKRGVQDALNHIKELDSVMNKISIVTNMSTSDLWQQVDSYSAMAQKYGTSIKGAYEVSQIYYQQGLQTSEVLTLTNETLKLAKISGLDYATTTDYMTTALRGFKMEAEDASRVVDVYSNLAAHTAVSQEELAVAMSKTASSLESVGSTFEEGSAMIGTMVAVTRESATNIGSALKSIAARYGEMKKDTSALIDSEGEALAYNKVDAALQSVGITLKDTDGQFRNFTDVIIELGEKWNQLESTQQRYIATQFAGNRQQSRFLALVSNVDLLKSNLNYAEDSEDTGTLQALKSLDSIESKTEQVRVAYQQMYTTIGAEDIWKSFLDGAKNVMETLNGLPKLFGKLPVGAIAMVADFVKIIKDVGISALGGISKLWDTLLPTKTMQQKGTEMGTTFATSITDAIGKSFPALKEIGREAAIQASEGAKDAQNDATTPAKPATEAQRTEVAAPVKNVSTQAIEQDQHIANAAVNTAQMANDQERAADAAERQAQAVGSTSAAPVVPVEYAFDFDTFLAKINELQDISQIDITPTINLAKTLNEIDSEFLPTLQSQLSKIDFSVPDIAQQQLTSAIQSYIQQAGTVGNQIKETLINADPQAIQELIKGFEQNLNAQIQVNSNVQPAILSAENAVAAINAMTATIQVIANTPNLNEGLINGGAGGSIDGGSAKAAGSRQTLVGELGPEMYVSNGRYYIAGTYGPEMVDLPSDAIVFNHLQTKDLLKNQRTGSTGKPVTNERKSTAMASGNLDLDSILERIAQLEEQLNGYNQYLRDNPAFRQALEDYEAYSNMWQESGIPQQIDALWHGPKVDEYGLTHPGHYWDGVKPKSDGVSESLGYLYKLIDEEQDPQAKEALQYQLRRKAYSRAGFAISDIRNPDNPESPLHPTVTEKFGQEIKNHPAYKYYTADRDNAKKLYGGHILGDQLGRDVSTYGPENVINRTRIPITPNSPDYGASQFYQNEEGYIRRRMKNNYDVATTGPFTVEDYNKVNIELQELQQQKAAAEQAKKQADEDKANKEEATIDQDTTKKTHDLSEQAVAAAAAKIEEETDKAYEQAEAQQAAEDKARVEAINNPLWDKDAQEQLKNNPPSTAAEEERQWRADLAQMDADVKLRLDTTEAKQEEEAFKTTLESEPIKEEVQTTTSNGLSVDEQIAKWQQLKDITQQLREAQENQDTSKIDELSQKQWNTANALGIKQGYKSFLPEEIDSQISKLRGESSITLETHADTTPIQEEVKKTKEKIETETEPVQMSMFDDSSTSTSQADAIAARQQEILKFYGGNKNIMFDQFGTDEQMRAVSEGGANSPEQAEINFQALKGLQAQRVDVYNQEIEALNKLKAARAEVDSISKKENPEEYDAKWKVFQDARKAYQDISGEKLNPNLGQQKIQEKIDSITAKRDLIIEPQVKINPEEVKKPIEEAPPAKVPVEPQQVKMDLDHPGENNFVYVTPKVDESAIPQVQQEIQQGIEQVNGQISLDQIIRAEDIKQQIEVLKQALEELNNYTFDEKSGNFINGNKSMSEADYMALHSKYTSQIDSLTNEQQRLQMNPMVETPPVDMSATQEQIQNCIDKLVEMGSMSQQTGDALKDGLQGASPDELKAKLEELKAKVQEVGETGTSAGSKIKLAFSKNVGSIGAAMGMIAGLFDKTSRGGQQVAGSIMAIGGAIRVVDALSKAAAGSNPWMALAMGIMGVVNGISMFIEDDAERLERLEKAAEEASNKAKQAKSDTRELETSKKKIDELAEKRYESAEATEEYQNAVDNLAEKFPQLIAGFDEAGNVILDTTEAENVLTNARKKAAEAIYNAAKAEMDAAKEKSKQAKKELKNLDIAVPTGSVLSSDEEVNSETKYYDIFEHFATYGKNVGHGSDIALGEAEFGATNSEQLTAQEKLSNIYTMWQYRSGKLDSEGKQYKDTELSQPYDFLAQAWNEEKNEVDLDQLKKYFENKEGEQSPEEQKIFDLFFSDQGKKESLTQDYTVKAEVLKATLADENASTKDIENAYKEANTALQQMYQSKLFDTKDLADYTSSLSSVAEQINKVVSLNDIYKGYEKEVISAWQSSIATNSDAWETLSKSSSASALVTKYIEKSISDADIDYDTAVESGMEANWQRYQQAMADFVGRFSNDEELIKKFNTMVSDSSHYTSDDILKEFGQFIVGDNREEIIDIITSYYTNGFIQTKDRLQQALAKAVGNTYNADTGKYADITDEQKNLLTPFQQDFFNLTSQHLSGNEGTYLNNILKEYSFLTASGYTTKAESYGTQALLLFDSINGLDAEIQSSIWDIILKNGITTKEGINNAIEAIESNTDLTDEQKSDIKDRLILTKDYIISNVGLELQTALDSYLEGWKTNSKTFSKLSSGIDFDDVDSILTSKTGIDMGLSIDDFVTDGNQLILTAEKAQQYVKNYFIDEQAKLKQYQSDIDDSLGTWAIKDNGKFTGETKLKNGMMVNENGLAEIESIIGEGNMAQYAEWNAADKLWKINRADELNEAIVNNYNNAQEVIARYIKYLEVSEKQITQANEWKAGDYSSLKDIFKLDDSVESDNELQEKLTELTKRGADLSSYAVTPDVKNAVTKIQGATSKFISDIISKGIENIDFTDYEGLPEWIAEDVQKNKTRSNYELAKKYAEYIGGTIEDSNNLIASALEKDLEKTTTDAIKDLSFINSNQFSATTNELKEFANRYDLDLANLIDQGIAFYDKTIGEYVVNYTQISGFDTSKIEGFQETVQDSIDSLFEKLAKLVTDGINGALSNLDRKSLEDQAKKYGISDLEFIKTNGGWELTLESSSKLLAAMAAGDASVAEMNKLAMAQFNKEVKAFTTDDIKDLTFVDKNHFTATSDELLTFADKFNLNLYDLMQNRIITWNQQLGEYVVDYIKIDGLGLSQIEGFQATVQDSINTFWKQLGDLIKSGIAGSLNHTDFEQLQQYANAIGFKGKLNFDHTADGLKLAQTSAIQLYQTLKQVDALEATLVFAELNTSLQETNEHYRSITSIQQRIIELNSKISQSDDEVSQVRKQQYDAELKVAKEILAVRSTTEDAGFNFMSNEIPGGQKNPINYYNNWAQALQKIRDALKTSSITTDAKGHKTKNKGLIDYQDWYNIVTEMNNLAKLGSEIELAGIKLDGSAEKAAALIQKGAAALTIDSSGQVKVALGNIEGFGKSLKASTKNMTDGIDAGLKDMAQSQINMLDGLIAMLEAIVAFESLGDIDQDGMGIDLTDLFEFKTQGNPNTDITSFTIGYEHWRDTIIKKINDYLADPKNHIEDKDLVEALQNISLTIDGQTFSLENMIRWDVSDFQENAAFANAYTSLVNALVKAAQSGNYDLDNIAASVQQELAAAGVFDKALVVNIGESTLLFSGFDHAEIKWDDAEVQALVQRIGPEGRTTLTEVMSKWLRGETLGEHKLEYILELKKKLRIEENGDVTVTYGDNHSKTFSGDNPLNTKEAKAWLGAAALEESGFNEKDIVLDETKGVATTEKIYTNKKKIVVTGTDTGVEWYSDKLGKSFSSEQKLFEAEYQAYSDGIDAAREATHYNIEKVSYDEYIWRNYQVRTIITSSVVDKDGNKYDITNDPTLRDELKDIRDDLKQGQEDGSWEKLVSPTGDGNYTIKLKNGFTAQLDGAKITDVNGKLDYSKLYAELSSMLNADQGLIDNIQEGIKKAFEDDTISNSLSTAIGQAFTSEDGVPIPEIKIDPENLGLKEGSGDKLQAAVTEAAKDLKADIDANVDPLKATVQAIELPDLTIDIYGKYKGITGLPTDNQTKTILEDKKEKTLGEARGNFGLAKAQGTLMGELGPELVVSNGHYFVVGRNGPEMVNLADDAIVFNHLQTKSLLEKGMSSGRGQAVTNERTAIAFATGNINGGPAMASASAALAALKQLRAQWQALLGLSAKDLAGKGGGGGGGGGNDPKAFIKELEKWYNWLQKIAQLEKEISMEEAKRSKYQSDFTRSGGDYFKSQIVTLDKLKEQLSVQDSLNKSQEEYFNQRRQQLNTEGAFRALYTFDENGQLKYQEGALAKLSDLVGRDAITGESNYTIDEQYQKIVEMGYEAQMKYDSSGAEIKQEGDDWKTAAVQAFWDKIDADKEEMQSLHDDIEEGKKKVIELETQQNEILHEMEDKYIEVENKIMKAIEENRQREIDEFKDTRDAIEKSNNKLINGLTQQLEKERSLYEDQQNVDEFAALQRRLAILQRSGGSAAEIANLQNEIADKQRDMYFNAQQKEIDALQEASDNELERLDHQIDIMQETLDYEKEFGLLWNDVDEVLHQTPEQIATFIRENTSEYWNKSATDLAKTVREDLFDIDYVKEYQNTVVDGLSSLVAAYGDKNQIEEEQTSETSSSSTYSENVPGTWIQSENGKWWYQHSADGGYTQDNWEKINDKWYHFDEEGWMETGWKQLGKNWFYLGDDGAMVSNGTFTIDGKEYIFDEQGVLTGANETTTEDTGTGSTVKYWTVGDTKYDSYKEAQAASDAIKEQIIQELKDTDLSETEIEKQAEEQRKKFHGVIPHYLHGGLVENTGIAWLDGTVQEPETVLNAEQTKILRDNILSNRPNSLISLLKSYNEAYKGLSQATYDSLVNTYNENVTIERAEVNLQIERLANDYDSRRAANAIMDEMLHIASKTSANNSIRR